MSYFVTGATGFIGRYLVRALLQRGKSTIYVLVRPRSVGKLGELHEFWGKDAARRVIPIKGDLGQAGLGVGKGDLRKLKGKVRHFFHLGAVYDIEASAESMHKANIVGTEHALAFAHSVNADCFHFVSSIAAAGLYRGTFTEDMFEEAEDLDHPYHRTKHDSEGMVRANGRVPFRIYRPGAVVGHTQTGAIDKIDGPYYFFKTLQRLRDNLPRWLPLLGVEGGRVPIVPVDYVADAMVAIAHKEGLDGQAFCLIQSHQPTVGELIKTILEAAHGPEIARSFELPRLPGPFKDLAGQLAGRVPGNVRKKVSQAIGVPISALGAIGSRVVFDDKDARAALKGTGVQCPELKDYAGKLWEYWEHNLDLDVKVPRRAARKLAGKVVLITGASSGIGLITARKCAAAGAKVLLVARTREKLEDVQRILAKAGGEAHVYPCDLSNMESIDAMADAVLNDFGHVDVLVNNAGRSIRRAVMESLDRFHDFERTMQLNYFGAVRLILKLLPSMGKRKAGQIINISSIGVLANAARFSAYVASKSALDAFSRCLSAEVVHRNINITAIYMPLVRTPMIAPTKMYDYVPAWSPEKAGDTVLKAILDRPKSVATPLGTAASISYALWPKINDFILNKGFQLFPSSSAAKGVKAEKPTLEQVVFANVLRGEHW